LSTHKQDQAQGEHLDAQPAKQQLEGNQSNAKALSEVAKNQQTDEIQSLDQLKEFAGQIQEKIAQFKKSLLLLNSPAGIGLSTNEDIHLSADGQINQFAGDGINLSTQKNLITHVQNRISLFAAQNGIKQVAAKGKFEVQAQGDGMDLLAKQGIQIISTEDRIEITSPKEIVITAGGSQIKLNGSGIFPVTGGKFEVKAGQHLFMGGQSVSAKLPYLPKSDVKSTENKSYLIDSSTGRILANRKYRLIDPFLGTEIQGQSDSEGLIDSLKPEMLLEVLPISGKKYQDSLKSLPKTIIEPQAAGKEEKGKVLKAKDLASSEQVIAAAIKKHPELKDYINKMKADGYQLDSLPIVPTGSRLIEPKRLLVMAPNTGRSSYKYLNLFAPSETTFHTTIKMMIDGKYLPSQYFYVFAHGNTSLMLGTNGRSFVDKNKNVTIMQFIERLKSEGYSEEQTLVLVSCNTGNGLAPIAEILSKQEGIGTVYAPTSLGWYYSTLPDVRVYARFKKSATERKAEPRLSGHMRIFNGAETIKT
ncbi:DUF2345 domain-containing protein, partial [Acinetobacter sp. ANC 3882]|uniref:DUF2345 domain-containing protein n=1 Tax=Acinetobacter sp. ANC 3882 TaxID=2923423 RepID=UPI001F4B2536